MYRITVYMDSLHQVGLDYLAPSYLWASHIKIGIICVQIYNGSDPHSSDMDNTFG